MEDSAIVDLYLQRSDQAIAETDWKYGRYCHTIAYNICSNREDAEECVCGARSKIKFYEDTVLLNFPLYCTKCKRETKLGVVKFKIVVGDEPDAYSAEPATL